RPELQPLARRLLRSRARSAAHATARRRQCPEDLMLVSIDGRLVPRAEARISVFDHGLLYGDGVFEGIRIYDRRIFRLDAHLARLEASAHALGLTLPMDRRALAAAVVETVRANRQVDGYIRLVVTRGEGPLGLD